MRKRSSHLFSGHGHGLGLGAAFAGAIALLGGCGGTTTPDEMLNPDGPGGMNPGGMTVDYPKGDIGYKKGQQIGNLSFLWHEKGVADVGSAPAKITMADFYAMRNDGLKMLFVSGAAEWCGPCNLEAQELSRIFKDKVYTCGAGKGCTCAPITSDERSGNSCDFCEDLTKKPADCMTLSEYLKAKNQEKALRVVQMVMQDKDYAPATRDVMDRWAKTHDINFSLGIDPSMQVSDYIPGNSVPISLFVRVRDMVMQRRDQGSPAWASQMMDQILTELEAAK